MRYGTQSYSHFKVTLKTEKCYGGGGGGGVINRPKKRYVIVERPLIFPSSQSRQCPRLFNSPESAAAMRHYISHIHHCITN